MTTSRPSRSPSCDQATSSWSAPVGASPLTGSSSPVRQSSTSRWSPASPTLSRAPALARADVGIAIGAGTDVAIESAGLVLASDDPRGVLSLLRLSAAASRKMRQNLIWAAGYNVMAIPLAAGAFAWAGLVLAPAVGAVVMSLSTIVVALNAQLLRRVDLSPGAVTR